MDLNSYKSSLNEIKQYAKENEISDEEIHAIFEECFDRLENERSSQFSTSVIMIIIKSLLAILLTTVVIFIGLYNHPTTHNLLLQNMQQFIYPGLRFFRKLAVPVITKYPGLTNLYDEWCLLENPYFYVPDMDCWPCDSVISVPDLTEYNITRSFNTGIPFTRKETMDKVSLKDLYEMYIMNKQMFDAEGTTVMSNNSSFSTAESFLSSEMDSHPSTNENTHVTWRIIRINPGRVLRQLFQKLAGIPDWWGQSTERFVFVDEPKAPAFTLPNPECSNVVMQCTRGARLIKLIPSPECTQSCQTFTVLLSAGHSLWYNWWYWRPVSFPAHDQRTLSINYLTSYC